MHLFANLAKDIHVTFPLGKKNLNGLIRRIGVPILNIMPAFNVVGRVRWKTPFGGNSDEQRRI